MRIAYTLVLISIVFIRCTGSTGQNQETTNEKNLAQEIIDSAIEVAGSQRWQSAKVNLDFRNIHYTAERTGGRYTYSRSIKIDSTETEILDAMNNDGFTRTVNGEEAEVVEERQQAYSRSINSVIYFASLPFPLNDDAVIKKYLGEVTIKGQPYHEIKVTFEQKVVGQTMTIPLFTGFIKTLTPLIIWPIAIIQMAVV